MAEETAQRLAARLVDARLRERRACSAASDRLRSNQNEHGRLQVAEKRHGEAANTRQIRLRAHQLPDYNRLAFRNNPSDDYSVSRHVFISTMTEAYPYFKALVLPEKLNCLNLEDSQSH